MSQKISIQSINFQVVDEEFKRQYIPELCGLDPDWDQSAWSQAEVQSI